MKERPIIFSGPMVRAILDGAKTQTRRVVKPQPPEYVRMDRGEEEWTCKVLGGYRKWFDKRWGWSIGADWGEQPWYDGPTCPYGVPGDRLWVRETFADIPATAPGHMHYKANATMADLAWFAEEGWKWTPSIFMPRWASRITLEITGVRVERVRDISEEDARAEGIPDEYRAGHCIYYRPRFKTLWDSINAKRGFGWDSNPYVWVVEFKRVGADQ